MAEELAAPNQDDFFQEPSIAIADTQHRAQYQHLIEQYAHLVKAAVNRVDCCLPREVDRGILVGKAIMGLINTIHTTPPGELFEQQARIAIWKSIVKWLGEQPWLRRRLKQAADRLYEAYRNVSQRTDNSLAPAVLARELQVTEEQLRQWLNEVSAYFTAWPRSFLGVGDSPHSSRRIATAIAELPTRARVVVTLSHYEELSHDEIAQILTLPTKEIICNYAEAGLQLRALLAEAP